MDGWMDGWVDGRTDGRTDGRREEEEKRRNNKKGNYGLYGLHTLFSNLSRPHNIKRQHDVKVIK